MDLVGAALERLRNVDARLHSFITVAEGHALEMAEKRDLDLAQGLDRGPLHGIPVAVKDLFVTKGIRTTCHSASLAGWMPTFDAGVVERLAKAGAILLGKLGMHEFGFGGPSIDGPFPAVHNPWNLAFAPGGSSSGSGAAVAGGLCFGSAGSDTGGSIRTPASNCGVVGFKGSRGRVSRYGQIPLSPSLDHAGPIARTVEDCALLFDAMSGHDPRDSVSLRKAPTDTASGLQTPISGMRLGVPRRGWFDEGLGIDGEVEVAFEAALGVFGMLGAQVVELDGADYELASKANKIILVAEAYAVHEQGFREAVHEYGSSFRTRVLAGAFLSASDYLAAKRAGELLTLSILDDFRVVDAIVTPSAAALPEMLEVASREIDLRPRLTSPFNVAGVPAVSVPCGFSSHGLPIGLQIATPPNRDALALQLAFAYEQATPWHLQHPNLDGAAFPA